MTSPTYFRHVLRGARLYKQNEHNERVLNGKMHGNWDFLIFSAGNWDFHVFYHWERDLFFKCMLKPSITMPLGEKIKDWDWDFKILNGNVS